MIKKMVCIECPKSCLISVDIENCRVTNVTGAKCPRGAAYAVAESENPSRIFTSTVSASGLNLKRVPVRTDKPIPKKDLERAVEESRRIVLAEPVKSGGVVAPNFLGLNVNLIATRETTR